MHLVTERNRKWWVVIAMAITTLLMTIDFNGLTVALPTIGQDLDTSTTGLQWTINAYLLALAAPSVAAGRLADIFGRRKVLLIGTVVFIAGSAASGLAQADWWLIAARVVQGFGAAAFFAASLSIVSTAFPPEERSKGIGVWAGIGTVGLAIGPLIGGFLTQTLSWRWFFFVNIPVAVLAIILTLVAVRESRDESASPYVDFTGLLTITAGLAALVLAIQQGGTLGWDSLLVIGSLIAAVVLLGLFFIVEPRLRQPLIDLGLFANRGYVGANGVAFAQNFGFAALLFFLTLYLQNILGYSPLQAGFVFLAFSAVLAMVDSFAGRLAATVGSRLPMAAGMALCAVAFLLLLLLTPTSGLTIVILALLVAGVGQALAYTVSTTAGMQSIPEAKAGAASGILSMIRLVGAVFGVAVTGALFKERENGKLAELLAASGAKLDSSDRAEIQGLLSGSAAAEEKLTRIAPDVARQIEQVVREAFVYAFDGAMLLCMVVSVAGVLAALLVASKTPQRTAGPTPGTGKPGHPDR
ncbi:MAG TPA: MFS transporter [Rubrobacter sp.]|jgi:EmrB/QacA subfamily drug resistance transporter|nr:MFS transporter [Rubrobacter sp.]